MLTKRPADARGHANHGWLDSHHTFSFAGYYDPKHLGFGPLLVINEDRVAPGRGFGPHPHRNMEIISYVLDGALEHRDSMGTGSVIRPGEVQYMSAGTGVVHSEMNHSREEPVHFLQIWIVPDAGGGEPKYDQREFPREERINRLRLLASGDGSGGSIRIGQDARLYGSIVEASKSVDVEIAAGRSLWLHVARGLAHADGTTLSTGDGASLVGPAKLTITADEETELLVVDRPGEGKAMR